MNLVYCKVPYNNLPFEYNFLPTSANKFKKPDKRHNSTIFISLPVSTAMQY
jgi:hypothetical protein